MTTELELAMVVLDPVGNSSRVGSQSDGYFTFIIRSAAARGRARLVGAITMNNYFKPAWPWRRHQRYLQRHSQDQEQPARDRGVFSTRVLVAPSHS